MTRGWFKSSYSDSGNDQCVEVRIDQDTVGVRDSKSPTAGAIWLPPTAWTEFLRDIAR
jgi:hypothetical protein